METDLEDMEWRKVFKKFKRMMSRVIEALGRKRKCTNYRDGLSWRSIGGGDWLVHGPTPTSGVYVCVCVLLDAERLDASTEDGFL